MTGPTLEEYRARLSKSHRVDFYQPRRFQSTEDWERVAGAGYRSSMLTEYQPLLSTVLQQHRALIVLGEPGHGKSTTAKAAIPAAFEIGWLPIFANLRSYAGALSDTFDAPLPLSSAARLYILDGLDEIPADQIGRFVAEIIATETAEPTSRFLLTSRQAFFVSSKTDLTGRWPTMYLADLTYDDIDTFVRHFEVDPSVFEKAINEARLFDEMKNPFNLRTALVVFKRTGRLAKTRSDAVRQLIDSLLESRPTSKIHLQRRALRMLGVTMETLAQNELTEEQCVRTLVRSNRIDEESATQLLTDLTESVLIRTPKGFAFQMRSYGEYLAAEDLRDITDPHRILPLIWLDHTIVPGESWRNAVSFLVEMHPRIRNYFVLHHPDWVLPSTVSCCTDTERGLVVEGVLDELTERREHLLHHPTVRAALLGRFVVPAALGHLKSTAQGEDQVAAANALLTLAASGDRDLADLALDIGLDDAKDLSLRHTALAALQFIGRREMIPRLLNISSWQEFTATSRLSAAAACMDISNVADVLRALGQADVTISAAVDQFGSFRSADEIEVVLQAVDAFESNNLGGRFTSYFRPVWRQMVHVWRPEWAPLIARLVLRLHKFDPYDLAARDLLKILMRHEEIAAAVGSALVDCVLAGEAPDHLNQDTYRLVDLPTAIRAVESGHDPFAWSLRAWGRDEVRAHLQPPPPTQDAAPSVPAEWQRRQVERETRLARLRERARSSTDGGQILNCLSQLEVKQWPVLPETQRNLVAEQLQQRFPQLDLAKNVTWEGLNSWRTPGALRLLMELLDRFDVQLSDDRQLALAVTAHEYERVARYHVRIGLSNEAWQIIRDLAENADVHDQSLDCVMRFARHAKANDPALLAAAATAATSTRPAQVRTAALDYLLEHHPDTAAIRSLLPKLSDDLRASAELHLVDRGDRPTIEKRLSALIEMPSLLDSGEVERPHDNPLSWLTRIRADWAWEKLKKVRRLALVRNLPGVASVLTSALAAIDMIKAADVILEQIDLGPKDWEVANRRRARELQRDGTVLAAQSVPFERVLSRMAHASTMLIVRLVVEGVKDVAGVETLVGKALGDLSDCIQVRPIGGWAQILAAEWNPQTLADGCHDWVVLMDGDRARDFGASGFPIRPDPEVRAALAKFERVGVKPHVLERYAIENYFPRAAFEAVVGAAVTGVFPLNPGRSVASQVPGYSKDRNGDLAAATSISDLAGTDLGGFLDELKNRCETFS